MRYLAYLCRLIFEFIRFGFRNRELGLLLLLLVSLIAVVAAVIGETAAPYVYTLF
jgi:hypothetical protein